MKIFSSRFSFKLVEVVAHQNAVEFNHVFGFVFLFLRPHCYRKVVWHLIIIQWIFPFWFWRDNLQRQIFVFFRVELQIVERLNVFCVIFIFFAYFFIVIRFLSQLVVLSFRFTSYHPFAFVRNRDSFAMKNDIVKF